MKFDDFELQETYPTGVFKLYFSQIKKPLDVRYEKYFIFRLSWISIKPKILFDGLILFSTQLLSRSKFDLWCNLIKIRSEPEVFEIGCKVRQPALNLTLKLIFLSSCLTQLFVDSEVGLKNLIVTFQQLFVSKFFNFKCRGLFQNDSASTFKILAQFFDIPQHCLLHL